jgi:ferredoxin
MTDHRSASLGRRASLRIDPTACDGVGICAHLAPDLVTVDRWGYPIVSDQRLHGLLTRQAHAAIRGCPHRALFLE